MRVSLFRNEVNEARAVKSIGAAVLLRPVPMRLAGAGAAVIGVLLVALVTVGHYTRKTHVQGHIEPVSGSIRVVAQQSGTLVGKLAPHGARVHKGQLLFELSSERDGPGGDADTRIDKALVERRELLSQELGLQTIQLERRLDSLKQRAALITGELLRLDQEKSLQVSRSRRANDLRARYRQLRVRGFIAEPQMATIDNDAAEQQGRLHALDRQRFALDGERLQNAQDCAEIRSQISLIATQSARTRAALDQESAEHQGRARAAVLAPADGVLTAVTAEAGQTVQAGAVLGTIIPMDGELEAILFAPSTAIGFAEPGQLVMLRVAAFPYQEFGQLRGRITAVDTSPIATAAQQGGVGSEQLFRIRVSLPGRSIQVQGKQKFISPGTEVSGVIMQERRTLLAWIVDPVISASGWRDPPP